MVSNRNVSKIGYFTCLVKDREELIYSHTNIVIIGYYIYLVI